MPPSARQQSVTGRHRRGCSQTSRETFPQRCDTNVIPVCRTMAEKMKQLSILILIATSILIYAMGALTDSSGDATKPAAMPKVPPGAEVITLGAGCFWCTEAVYQQIPGVLSVTSGY